MASRPREPGTDFKIFFKQQHLIMLSKCTCPKVIYEDKYQLCESAVTWLRNVEERTDMRIDYERAVQMYDRIKNKRSEIPDFKQIKHDIARTFPEEPFFKTDEGR
jgi:hypothetical protein